MRSPVRIWLSAPRRSKVPFAPTSFYATGKKDVIRPLPCSSFPTATRCAGLAVGGPPCGRHVSSLRISILTAPSRSSQAICRLRRAFLFHCKTHRALILLLLASKPDPLRWAREHESNAAAGNGFGPQLVRELAGAVPVSFFPETAEARCSVGAAERAVSVQ